MKKIYSNSSDDTQKMGEEFAKKLGPGDIVLMYGDLGAGKTTFTKGLAMGLGIDRRVMSPTFTVIRNYEGDTYHLVHIDLYRLDGEEHLKGIGLEDLFQDKTSIKVIEWAEKLSDLPSTHWKISFEHLQGKKRKIDIIHNE